jgi:TonB-dependent receptor
MKTKSLILKVKILATVLSRKSLFVFLFLTISSALFAQTMVSGIVSDANNGSSLPAAQVYVDGTTIGTISDLNGEYRLPLSPGSYSIAVSFMGYELQKQEVTLLEAQNTKLDFKLSPQSIMGMEVVVSAMMRGQRSAINSQLNAAGIVNSVSEEQIQELPDANAGEAIGRLPGVSLKRSGGEAEKIVLRGLGDNYSMIQLDGVAIPSTDEGGRGVDLSLFSINSLAGIEVTKALTSDMDADAIAGAVNLVTKKASREPELRIDLGTAYNNLEKSVGQYNAGLRYGRRLLNEKMGVQFSANTERKIRSSEEYSQDWDVNPDSTWQISSLTTAYTKEIRTRVGGSLLMDFELKNGGALRFNNFFNSTGRDAVYYYRTYPTTETVTYSILDTERKIHTLNNALSGEHFVEKFKVNWGVSHALSVGETPYYHQLTFSEGGSFESGMMAPDEDDLHGPGDLLVPLAYNNFSAAYLSGAYQQTAKNKDRDLTAYLDLERTLKLSDGINIVLKAGGKYRSKNRSNDVDRYWSPYSIIKPRSYQQLEDGSIVAADFTGTSFEELEMVGGTNVGLNNFLGDNPTTRSIMDGRFTLNPMIDADLAREWYETHKNGISLDGSQSEYMRYHDCIDQIYDVTERIASGYAMATINLGSMVRVIGGVRVENENNDYTSKFAPDIAGYLTYDPSEVADTSASYNASYILPNFHLRFKPFEWWDLRLAATKTLSRPSFSMRLPNIVVLRSSTIITRGNPDLKTTEAWNYDVISSLYSSKYGLFTVGGFYKRLDNISYELEDVNIINADMEASLNLPEGYGSYVGLALTEPINTSGTEIFGIEFDLQANMKFLPGLLSNFILRGNFTMINSTTNYPRFTVEQDNSVFPPTQTPVWYEAEGRLNGQPSSFGNCAIGYNQGGFSGRLSVFFQGDYLNSVSSIALYDQYQKGYSKWDLSLKQDIRKYNMEIMLNVSNLTNMSEGTYYKYQNLDNGSSTFGLLANLGVRLTL